MHVRQINGACYDLHEVRHYVALLYGTAVGG